MDDEAKPEQPDDSEPTPDHQAELRAAYHANVVEGKAPYANVAIRTRGELSWVMRERDWSGDFDAGGKERADLSGARLDGAVLSGAVLYGATLSGADLRGATLTDVYLGGATLSGANLYEATLTDAYLVEATLSGADLRYANASGARLHSATVSGADLRDADLSGARLGKADLSGADLRRATLSGADLYGATLSGAKLSYVNLSGAYLGATHMNADTDLTGARLDARTRLADIVWNSVPVTRLNWEDVGTLGDEWVAHLAKDTEGKPKDKAVRLDDFQDAVLANRQVATLLRGQGLNEHADRFAYRAQLLQRQVLRRQRQWLRWLGSVLLDAVAGYGYRPIRSVFTYALVVLAFAAAYFGLGGAHGQALSWNESLVVSLTAFHGRGFFAAAFQPGDLQAAVAAIEAVFGLLIEITFIATFTNRFFAR